MLGPPAVAVTVATPSPSPSPYFTYTPGKQTFYAHVHIPRTQFILSVNTDLLRYSKRRGCPSRFPHMCTPHCQRIFLTRIPRFTNYSVTNKSTLFFKTSILYNFNKILFGIHNIYLYFLCLYFIDKCIIGYKRNITNE